MSRQDGVAIVRRLYAALGSGDGAALSGLFADAAALVHPMPTAIWPWAGRRRGRDEIGAFFAGIAATLEFECFEPRQFIAQDDTVVVLVFERLRIYEDIAPIVAAVLGGDAL